MANIIQTFTIAASAVNNVSTVFLTAFDLYFSRQPSATNNNSGINNPGVSLFICPVVGGVPDPKQKILETNIRLAYSDINVSTDSSLVTTATLASPVILNTGTVYGLVVMTEDAGYTFWYNKSGDALVGTNNPSAGSSGNGFGAYYEYTDSTNITPLTDRVMKISVDIAQFTSNTSTVDLVNNPYEFLQLAPSTILNFNGGEVALQDFGKMGSNVTFYCNGSVNIQSGNATLVGVGTTFSSLFAPNDYIVVSDDASNIDAIKISAVTNATSMVLARAPYFTNTAGSFKKTVTGTVYNYDPISKLLILTNSTANSTMYFANSSILGANIISGGIGYNNTDILTIYAGGSSVNATASIKTAANGAIIRLNFSNTGLNFNTNPNIIINNSIGGNTAGSGANISANQFGSYVVGTVSQNSAIIAQVQDYPVSQIDPEFLTIIPSDATIVATHNFAYSNGSTFLVNNSNFEPTTLPGLNSITDYNAIVMSRSHEVTNSASLYPGAKSGVIKAVLNHTSGGVFYDSPLLYNEKLDVFVLTNQINNSVVGEHNPAGGNALSRHITTQISFANNLFAEDLLVYVDAWVPPGTNVHMFAKMYKSTDADAFNDKYWTPLALTDPSANVRSSSTNANDVIQFTYSLPSYPPVVNTIAGFITATNNSVTITGIGTNFISDLTVDGLIRLYDPNFTATNYMVGLVTNITNATSATIDIPVTNNSILHSGTGVTSGLVIDNLKYNQTAFKNNQNFNVARYYNSSFAYFDQFNTFNLKVVFTSNNQNIAPIISDIRAIGVSA
jgi:ABC-type cobalt transport system substrate-binding protein